MAAFALSGGLSAFGGVLLAGYASKAAQAMGDPYLLPAIAAVVLGGTSILGGRGSYLGTVAGVDPDHAAAVDPVGDADRGIRPPRDLRRRDHRDAAGLRPRPAAFGLNRPEDEHHGPRTHVQLRSRSIARFRKLALPYIHVEKLYTGCRWAEGPAWFAAGRYLVWSDIPNDRMLRWDETDGSVSVFRQPAMNSNGHTVDLRGAAGLVRAPQPLRVAHRVRRHAARCSPTAYDGKRFNSPNDVVVKSDGSVWFTDPSYGIDSDYEGDAATSEIGACNVYRIDPASGRVTIVACGLRAAQRARVLARRIAALHRRHRRSRTGPTVRTMCGASRSRPTAARSRAAKCSRPARSGVYDGFRVDVARQPLAVAPATACTATRSDGSLLGKIRIPETVANVCFGGPKLNRLFICGTTSLYSVFLNTRAAPRG